MTEIVNDHICEISMFSGRDAAPEAVPRLVIEVPHGATRLEHLERVKALINVAPDPRNDLFFLANTDQGAPEYATWLARCLTNPDLVPAPEDPVAAQKIRTMASRLKIVMIRSLVPRTLVDVNRTWEGDARSAGLTGVTGAFISDPRDLEVLQEVHSRYLAATQALYDLVCGTGGFGLNLHTYAPISLQPVEGRHIADVIKEAYTTDAYHQYPVRPLVELITQPPGEQSLAPAALVANLRRRYMEVGVKVCENDPFTLHPSTCAYAFSKKYPGQVLLMEISRAELAEPFDPFVEMNISPEKIERMTRPLALALIDFLQTP